MLPAYRIYWTSIPGQPLLAGSCYKRHCNLHLIDNRFVTRTGTNSDRVVYHRLWRITMKLRSESYPDRIRRIAQEVSQLRNLYQVDHTVEKLHMIANELEQNLKNIPRKKTWNPLTELSGAEFYAWWNSAFSPEPDINLRSRFHSLTTLSRTCCQLVICLENTVFV